QKGELARDLMRKEGLVGAGAVRDLMRAEDDLVGVRVPQAADSALGRRGREGLEIAERQPKGRLLLVKDVRAEFVSLCIEGRSHGVPPLPEGEPRGLPASGDETTGDERSEREKRLARLYGSYH